MKANFTMTMDYEPQYTAIANMPDETTEELPDGWKQTKFAMSVPMSTYLVCYVVSDFVYKNDTTVNGVEVSTCTFLQFPLVFYFKPFCQPYVVIDDIKRKGHPNPKLSMFMRFLKMFNTSLKNNIQVVSKWLVLGCAINILWKISKILIIL